MLLAATRFTWNSSLLNAYNPDFYGFMRLKFTTSVLNKMHVEFDRTKAAVVVLVSSLPHRCPRFESRRCGFDSLSAYHCGFQLTGVACAEC